MLQKYDVELKDREDHIKCFIGILLYLGEINEIQNGMRQRFKAYSYRECSESQKVQEIKCFNSEQS